MHRTLERQVKHFLGSLENLPPAFEKFLAAVSDTYTHTDEDRQLLNTSFDISSKEFLENNQQLRETKEQIEKEARERIEDLEKYQTLVDNLSIGVYRNTPGPEGHFLEANPAMVTMFEADSKEEFLKHNVSDFYQNPANRALFVEKMMKNGLVKDEELELVTIKGTKIVGSVSAVMKKDKEGSIYFDGVIENITERKELEKKLKEYAEERFKILFENIGDGMSLADVETRQLSLGNTAFSQMTGYSPEEVRKMHVSDLHLKEDLPYILDQFDKQARGEIKVAQDIRVKRKDGSIFYSDVNASPITLDGKKFLLAVFRDITYRKEAEKKGKEYLEEVENMNKLMVGREMKMIELKEEIEQLKAKKPFEKV
ncbi:MAG: PAS domain S-box protein [Minisyncoccia bacterium]